MWYSIYLACVYCMWQLQSYLPTCKALTVVTCEENLSCISTLASQAASACECISAVFSVFLTRVQYIKVHVWVKCCTQHWRGTGINAMYMYLCIVHHMHLFTLWGIVITLTLLCVLLPPSSSQPVSTALLCCSTHYTGMFVLCCKSPFEMFLNTSISSLLPLALI